MGPLQCWWVLKDIGGSLGILVGPYIIEKVNIFNIIGVVFIKVAPTLYCDVFCGSSTMLVGGILVGPWESWWFLI